MRRSSPKSTAYGNGTLRPTLPRPSLREVSAILNAKAPADATVFKAWLQGISQKVAEAAVEGGFVGFGGKRISDAERASLGDIADALDATA